jgi:hypothetical protein
MFLTLTLHEHIMSSIPIYFLFDSLTLGLRLLRARGKKLQLALAPIVDLIKTVKARFAIRPTLGFTLTERYL